ncbi:hypothetical protein GGS20DRAFT_588590 [Poronia punctata]|nr:hypothetical protein GGS20DRAFT_588590 [Poronia punctata]
MALRIRRRGNRLAIIAQIQAQAAARARAREAAGEGEGEGDNGAGPSDPMSMDNSLIDISANAGLDDEDIPDFATDFDDVELTEQLQHMRDEASLLFDPLEVTSEGNVIETAQDGDFPDIEELQQLADFQIIDEDPPEDDDISDGDNEEIEGGPVVEPGFDGGSAEEPETLLASSRKPWDDEDKSEPIPHRRNFNLLPDLHMALATWTQLNGITNSAYRGLKEILQSQVTADTLDDIATLPVTVHTLKNTMKRRLPLIEMRKASIPLRAEKLSTARLSRKQGGVPNQDLYYFNCVEYLKALILSKIKDDMYFGLALLVDDKDKIHPWHSRAWASSARSTSGQFARGRDGEVILPSDFVVYECHVVNCPTCHRGETTYHHGRVVEVWRDQRSEPLTVQGEVILRIEPIVRLNYIKGALADIADDFENFMLEDTPDNEYVLLESQGMIVAQDHVQCLVPVKVHIDNSYGSSVDLPDDTPVSDIPAYDWFIRRKVNTALKRFFPIVQSDPIRAELEVEEFTREAIIKSLSRENVYSVPFILFADGFGLYRTMHKSIMGIYLGIASLKRADRLRQMNVMPVTLGPHGSNDDDVWKQIGHSLRGVENGLEVDLHGQPAFIYGHVLFLSGDFPQQQENSGFRRPTAKQGCRMCDVTLTDRGNLDFDLTSGRHHRHHHEIMRQRASMNLKPNKAQKERVANMFGLAMDTPMLFNIIPALDVIRTRPADVAHSELGGITKMIHLLIIDQVLTPTGNTAYAKVMRLFPLHPGWPRIQSPHHVLQYSLTEHGRWAVVAPILFRTWLKANSNYVKLSFRRAIKEVFARGIRRGEFGEDPDEIDILVKILVSNVSTVILLTTDNLPVQYRDTGRFNEQVKQSRRLFQLFCEATSTAVSRRSQSRSAEPVGSMLPTVASGTEAIESGPAAVSAAIAIQSVEEIEDPQVGLEPVEMTTAKSTKYKLWMSRPNVHIGLHYQEVLEEYGLPSLPNVIVFEIKHKLWKKMVYTTNHRAPEKDLFAWENVAQTLRFVLLNSFADTDRELTNQLQNLNSTTPSLFASITRGQLVPGGANGDDEVDDDEAGIVLVARHESYIEVGLTAQLRPETRQKLGLATREKDFSPMYRRMLTSAYANHYSRQVTIMGTGQRLKWWGSVTWSTKNELTGMTNRVTKRPNQHVRCRTEENNTVYGRIDHIFSHAAVYGDERVRVFLVVSPVSQTGIAEDDVDQATGLDIYSLQDPIIVGLPALSQENVYMVPFKPDANHNWMFVSDFEDRSDCRLLHVNWNVGFM